MKADMSEIAFAGENFSSPLPYSFWYVPWEAQQVSCNVYNGLLPSPNVLHQAIRNHPWNFCGPRSRHYLTNHCGNYAGEPRCSCILDLLYSPF